MPSPEPRQRPELREWPERKERSGSGVSGRHTASPRTHNNSNSYFGVGGTLLSLPYREPSAYKYKYPRTHSYRTRPQVPAVPSPPAGLFRRAAATLPRRHTTR